MEMSPYDPNQITRMIFDEPNKSQRVTLVGMDNLVVEPKLDLTELKEAMKPSAEVKIEKIEVPTIVKEVQIQVVEVPKIVVQEKVTTIEVPVIVKEKEIVTLHIPATSQPQLIASTKEYKSEKFFKVLQVVQSVALLGILVKLLLQ
jgi:hypothetical protein